MHKKHQGEWRAHFMPSTWLRVVAAALSLVFAAVALGQSPLGWSLGSYSLPQASPSPSLTARLSGPRGLTDYGFVSSVGGVAFISVAELDSSITASSLSVSYLPEEADGRRLEVRVNGSKFAARLPDWMVIPIGHYADSDYNACVSLFGPASGPEFHDIVYHEAFGHGLLGVRLLQADVLLMDVRDTWRLPAVGGKTLLGAGESEPQSMNQDAAMQLSHVLSQAQIRSWVLTDVGESVRVEVRNSKLYLTGAPYYFFWDADVGSIKRERDGLIQQLEKVVTVEEHNAIVRRINALIPEVKAVSVATEAMKESRSSVRNFNPAVYDAALNTMRFAALFRRVKLDNPSNWREFLHSLHDAKDPTNLIPPNRWPKRH